jgi:hypothetical protein
MNKDERDLLDVLKAELAFLGKGGYGRSPREPWSQPLIFEDSPSCMNYDSKDHAKPCSACVLFQLVPPQFRGKQLPCRHISVNAEGETLDSLSRYSDQFKVEEVFGNWLRNRISTLEKARQTSRAEGTRSSAPGSSAASGESLSQKLHPNCPVLLAAEHPKQRMSGWRLAGLSGDEKFNPWRFPIGDNS